jgi:cell division septal protein FtsQ
MRLFKRQSAKKTTPRQPRLMNGQDDYTFRRSRTLTGTTSNKVKPSAEGSASQLKTPRLKEHELLMKRGRVLRLLGFTILCIAVLVLLIANFISAPPLIFAQKSAMKPAIAIYQDSIQQYFSTRPFERFGFSLNSEQFETFMQKQHSEIQTVVVDRDWYGGNVQLRITFRRPILVWQFKDQRFFVDDQGISFTYDHFNAPLVAVIDQSGVTPEDGNAVASQRFIRFLGKMVGAVNGNQQGRVVSVIIPSSTREIDLKLEGREYPIKTHIDRDPLQQAEDIAHALGYFDQQGVKPAYVDVRVTGKAFYK